MGAELCNSGANQTEAKLFPHRDLGMSPCAFHLSQLSCWPVPLTDHSSYVIVSLKLDCRSAQQKEIQFTFLIKNLLSVKDHQNILVEEPG